MDHSSPSVRVEPGTAPPPSARLVARMAGFVTGGESPRLFATIGRHRRLSRWWLPFAGTLLVRGRLPRADAELVVLRTACNTGSWYEWVQHVGLARRAGLTQAQIEAAGGEGDPGWSSRQKLLLLATDELARSQVISDATWARLCGHLNPEETIELCFLVGHYSMLAMVLNSLGVEPEPSALRRLDDGDRVTGAARVAGRLRDGLLLRRQQPMESPGDRRSRPREP